MKSSKDIQNALYRAADLKATPPRFEARPTGGSFGGRKIEIVLRPPGRREASSGSNVKGSSLPDRTASIATEEKELTRFDRRVAKLVQDLANGPKDLGEKELAGRLQDIAGAVSQLGKADMELREALVVRFGVDLDVALRALEALPEGGRERAGQVVDRLQEAVRTTREVDETLSRLGERLEAVVVLRPYTEIAPTEAPVTVGPEAARATTDEAASDGEAKMPAFVPKTKEDVDRLLVKGLVSPYYAPELHDKAEANPTNYDPDDNWYDDGELLRAARSVYALNVSIMPDYPNLAKFTFADAQEVRDSTWPHNYLGLMLEALQGHLRKKHDVQLSKSDIKALTDIPLLLRDRAALTMRAKASELAVTGDEKARTRNNASWKPSEPSRRELNNNIRRLDKLLKALTDQYVKSGAPPILWELMVDITALKTRLQEKLDSSKVSAQAPKESDAPKKTVSFSNSTSFI